MDTKKTKSGLEKAPIVYVEWVDAVSDAGWQENTKTEIHRCLTIGWIVSESDDAICVANTVIHDNQVSTGTVDMTTDTNGLNSWVFLTS